MNSINEQKAATKNQITNTKPEVKRHTNTLEGYIANSMNGGIWKPIAYKQVMKNERIFEYRYTGNVKMLTPVTPAYQKLKLVLKAYFVPNSRVWENAEAFLAQKGGATVTKIKEIPNMGSKTFPNIYIPNFQGTEDIYSVPYTDTDIFRDSYINCYIPKWLTGRVNFTDDSIGLPKYSILPLRGAKAIWNDFERNKEYDPELDEYKGDTVTNNEWDSYMLISNYDYDKVVLRGKRQNSYYTDYRTEMLGEDIAEPVSSTNDLINFTEWEKKVAELRSEAENAQLNDWDIIAKIRGGKKIKTGKVQLLGMHEIGLNYNAITQTTYNINENVQEEFQALGTQGAYSYTEVDIPMFQMVEFEEEGYIHITAQITADTVFESGFERTGLNVNIMDIYRPDLKDLKHDILYRIEKDGSRGLFQDNNEIMAVDGYKRKFSELFKLPNNIGGDMTTGGAYATKMYGLNNPELEENTSGPIRYIPQRSFQFFEIDDRYTNSYKPKKIWKDYTDYLINKNQAVRQEEETINYDESGEIYDIRIKGQNQVFFIAVGTCITELPVDEAIKENYTTWGEK